MGWEDGAVVWGDAVGVSVGSFVGVGTFVGDRVVGDAVGANVGSLVGNGVVGAFVTGDVDGWDVGGAVAGTAGETVNSIF
mmetsp:Transcript_16692/g.30359  ORF Transcript_16692/g.30359 Transcript_16692/m.30359 type:complete len:80 (-) Transcript_16692:362-601(-)